tara:strand:+ start:395 stop:679 length:285 start_codon:yes stop_codon:yes gene_type:complete
MSWKNILKTDYTEYKNYIHSQYEKNRHMKDITHKELVKEYERFKNASSEGPFRRDGEIFDNAEYDHKMMILHEYRLRVKEGRAKYPIAIENEIK